jgi:hypothetical protein
MPLDHAACAEVDRDNLSELAAAKFLSDIKMKAALRRCRAIQRSA